MVPPRWNGGYRLETGMSPNIQEVIMHRLKAIFHNLHTLLLLILVIALIVSACASVTDSYVDSLPVNDDSLFADAQYQPLYATLAP